MQVRDLDRIIRTREPVTLGKTVYRLESVTISMVGSLTKYTCVLREPQSGKRYQTVLDNLCYLDGRKSI